MSMKRRIIDACLETLCQKGCTEVLSDIQLLEQGRRLPEVTALSKAEQQTVLDELKPIMAVYEERGH
jgi:hypothetical protein